MENTAPWSFLDAYRGTAFKGEWPTLPEMFSITASRHPGNACFTCHDPATVRLNYEEALAAVRATAATLRSLGIGREAKVAVTGKNSPEWAVAYLGVLESGATVVPIDYQLSCEEISILVSAGDCVALFCDEEKYAELATLRPGLKAYFALWPAGPDYVLSLETPPAQDPQAQAGSGTAGENDIAAILFTSGTTGTPKGVMLSHRNLVSDCYLAQGNLGVLPTDVFYALLPIHHSYTMLAVFLEAISVGAEVVFGKRMVVKQILKDLKEAKVTMFLGVPLLFNKVLAGIDKGIKAKGPLAYTLVSGLMAFSGFQKKTFGINPGKRLFASILDKASLSSIRICISGGGPLAPSVFRRYNQLGIDFVQGYGLTETSPILTLNPVERYKETSVGKTIPGVQMRILDPDASGVGEIAVKGPMVMRGYYRMPEETAEVFTPDGWFRTGDLGYMDAENYVYLTGRAKNLIVTEGGKNVYPEEIENRFQLFTEVEQVLVRGYVENPDLKSEAIEALIYPSQDWVRELAGASAGAAAGAGSAVAVADKIRRHLAGIVDEVNQKLLPYQRISRMTVLEEALEMTTTKKVKRFSKAAGG